MEPFLGVEAREAESLTPPPLSTYDPFEGLDALRMVPKADDNGRIVATGNHVSTAGDAVWSGSPQPWRSYKPCPPDLFD